jgi:hypothetical protein|tara:strand:- start:1389 stop:1574 length:186 start_codon:yes stop_codon:yes gene_type:complete
MAEANEKADNIDIQITLEDLSIVLNQYPEFLKPLKVAAITRLKGNKKMLNMIAEKEAKNVK